MFKEPEKNLDANQAGKAQSEPEVDKAAPYVENEDDPYADIAADITAGSGKDFLEAGVGPGQADEGDRLEIQDNFVENKEPAELMFCIILASIYAGLARYFWEPLEKSHQWFLLINFEGFFITIAAASVLLGMRPYLSPSSLQISRHGIKYRGPYWPQRKTVNWTQVVHMYVSPELILIIYRVPNKPKSIRPLLIHSVYLADKDNIVDSILKYAPIEPTLVANPGIFTRAAQVIFFGAIVVWIFNVLRG